jgi:FlaA1/EpsC-like NDP-sugar epimerase
MGSRGSVIPHFLSIRHTGVLPVTDLRMTRFMITLEQAVQTVWHAVDDMHGGETYVRKIPSMRLPELAQAVAPEARLEVVGIRPGEKLHEQMISADDAPYTWEYPDHYKILPAIHDWHACRERIGDGRRVPEGFSYTSDANREWMSVESLRAWISARAEDLAEAAR